MFLKRCAAVTVTLLAAISGSAKSDGDDIPPQAAPAEVFPLPANTVFERHVVGEGDSAAAGDRSVYSNTLGAWAVALGAGRFVADDISINASYDCKLRRFEFPVVGKVDPSGIGGEYTVDFALYSNCPGSVPPAYRPWLIVSGTQGQAVFLDDAPRIISFTPAIGTLLPTNLWLGVRFSRDNAGVVVGAPAVVGFSADVVDWPGFPCDATFGGFPDQPHASFNAEIFVGADCSEAFTGFKNNNPSGSLYNPGPGVFLADDIHLGVRECQMIAYEVAVRGIGLYTFRMQDNCETGLIAGTEKIFRVTGTSNVSIARFTFDPPIPLPQDLWFETRVDNPTGSVVITGQQASIGSTGDSVYEVVNDECIEVPPYELGWGIQGAVNVTITCAGSSPVGACCDMIISRCVGGSDDGRPCCSANADRSPFCQGDPVAPDAYPPCAPPGMCESLCRETPLMNCPWPPRFSAYEPGWVEGASCDPDPFPFACGAAACCRPDQVCEILTQNECNTVPPIDRPRLWQLGRYCDLNEQWCPWVACLPREGECAASHEPGGCLDPPCCADVCDVDPWCCLVEWDTVCIREGQEFCDYTPRNNECLRDSGPGYTFQASEVFPNSSAVLNNATATQNPRDPAFTCHRDGSGIRGFHTTWFVFEATDVSARIHTCNTDPPAQDTLVAIYVAEDPSTPQAACGSLIEFACSDDAVGCGGDTGSDVCVTGLVAGQRYYIQVASHPENTPGVFELDIESPCPAAGLELGEVPPVASLGSPLPGPAAGVAEGAASAQANGHGAPDRRVAAHREVPRDPWMPRSDTPPPGAVAHAGPWVRDGYVSVQVNVDAKGNNIVGDAANEPSIAIDPNDAKNIVIGWRQFDSVESDFRQGGWGYSHDGGQTWVFPGVLEPGVFRSDPVLDVNAEGTFFYYSLRFYDDGYPCDMFRSTDKGVTWIGPTYAFGGDKAWIVADRTPGPGRGNIYAYWSQDYGCCSGHFTRSTDGGLTYDRPILIPGDPYWGTLAVAPDGSLFVCGAGGRVSKSANAKNPTAETHFDWTKTVDLGGYDELYGEAPNPGGLLGQAWVATPKPGGPNPNHVYLLSTVRPVSGGDSADIMFIRSTDGGSTWGEPVRVNDDPLGNGAWQWFGTMSVAPAGRIDVVWNDTRNTGSSNLSELYYAYSLNGGVTWSANTPISPVFNSHIGWPQQAKLGDYYHMISDNQYAKLAYAATFNGEQDVYFMQIPPTMDCNRNGIVDAEELANDPSLDCGDNGVPDECEPDFDADGIVDSCDDDMDNDGVNNAADVCLRTVVGTPIRPDGRPKSDTNQDCLVDLDDFWRIRNCMVNGRLGFPAPEGACREFFDHDSDGKVNLRDFAGFQNAFRALGR